MKLAERELPGYPGCTISLNVPDDAPMTVEIHDPEKNLTWHPKDRAEAKDMYFHPFVYGYNVPILGGK